YHADCLGPRQTGRITTTKTTVEAPVSRLERRDAVAQDSAGDDSASSPPTEPVHSTQPDLPITDYILIGSVSFLLAGFLTFVALNFRAIIAIKQQKRVLVLPTTRHCCGGGCCTPRAMTTAPSRLVTVAVSADTIQVGLADYDGFLGAAFPATFGHLNRPFGGVDLE
ncbi:hypothetical protein JCM11641_006668, partial [Rhodosporidiobolus odoratus]